MNHKYKGATTVAKITGYFFGLVFFASSTWAATVGGLYNTTGNYSSTGFPDVQSFSFDSIANVFSDGDFSGLSFLATPGNSIDVASFSPVDNVFSVDGLQFDLDDITVTNNTGALFSFTGTGVVSGAGITPTLTTWNFSSESGTNYSLSILASNVAIPVPAAIWLFGSALLGVVGLKKRLA